MCILLIAATMDHGSNTQINDKNFGNGMIDFFQNIKESRQTKQKLYMSANLRPPRM